MDPKVCVVIPAWNSEKYIAATLDSALGQTIAKDIQIIVVDDNSSDRTAEIVREYAGKYPCISLIQNGTNLQVSASRNKGIQAALKTKAEHIALLDSDDLWNPDKLEKQLAFLQAQSDKNFVCLNDYKFKSKDPSISDDFTFALSKEGPVPDIIIKGAGTNMGSTLLAHRSVFDTAGTGLFDEKMHAAEDWEWLLRHTLRGGKIHIIPEMLSSYLWQPGKLYGPSGEVFRYLKDKHAAKVRSVFGRSGYDAFMASIYGQMGRNSIKLGEWRAAAYLVKSAWHEQPAEVCRMAWKMVMRRKVWGQAAALKKT